MTLIRPFLLMILHLSQMGFTDDLTFTGDPPSVLKSNLQLCTKHKSSSTIVSKYFPFCKHYLFISPNDPSFRQVIGRKLNGHFVTR